VVRTSDSTFVFVLLNHDSAGAATIEGVWSTLRIRITNVGTNAVTLKSNTESTGVWRLWTNTGSGIVLDQHGFADAECDWF
jgi:hypothetical protein